MKNLKCPLCGKPLEFFQELKFGGLGRVGCSFCEWTTFLATPHKAWEAAEELISKYPPLMRVRAGDNLKLVHRDDILTVAGRCFDHGLLTLDNDCGEVEVVGLGSVDKWPWELEQEGGQQ